MKIAMLFMPALLALSGPGLAQTPPASTRTAMPPPGLQEAGVRPVASASASAPAPTDSVPAVPAGARTSHGVNAAEANLPGAPRDGRGEAPPTVRTKKHDGKLVEEYYRGGRLYMVRVHPPHGATYTYYVDENRHLYRGAGAPPPQPAMYTILTWGAPGNSDND